MRIRSKAAPVTGTVKSSAAVLLAWLLMGLIAPAEAYAAETGGEGYKQVVDDVITGLRAERIRKLTGYLRTNFKVAERTAVTIVTEAIASGAKFGLHPELILAIIAVESTFKARAVSHAGARGLMQIMPRAHPVKVKEIGGAHALFVPAKNISTGTRILNDYLDWSDGDLKRALLRYNGSLSNPRSRYPAKVIKIYNKLRKVTETEVASAG